MSEDKNLKLELVEFLQQAGFAASLIEEGPAPSADILATHPRGETYLFEVKARTTKWLDKATVVASQDGSTTFVRNDETGPSGTISRVFKKAATQLESTAQEAGTLRIIWFLADSSDIRYHYDCIAQTAYGSTIVAPANRKPMLGFYVRHAAFASWRSIDGVLLGPCSGLLINDLSPRHAALKASALAACCQGYVTDPSDLAAENKCYYLNPNEPDSHPDNSVLRLTAKYVLSNVKLVDLTRLSAAVAEPYTEEVGP